jgi:hypothetical protein
MAWLGRTAGGDQNTELLLVSGIVVRSLSVPSDALQM